MPKLDMISHSIKLPDGVSATIDGHNVTVAKDGKSLTREFRHPRVEVRDSADGVEVFVNLPRRKEKALAGTWAAHLNNMVRGIDSGFEYKLKAVYSHFPMTIKVQGNEMTKSLPLWKLRCLFSTVLISFWLTKLDLNSDIFQYFHISHLVMFLRSN